MVWPATRVMHHISVLMSVSLPHYVSLPFAAEKRACCLICQLNVSIYGLRCYAAVILGVPGNAHVALLAPIWSPRILHDPIPVPLLCLPIPAQDKFQGYAAG